MYSNKLLNSLQWLTFVFLFFFFGIFYSLDRITFLNIHESCRNDQFNSVCNDIIKSQLPWLIILRIGGSVVEFSPATREARVRFPADAMIFIEYCRIFF